MKALKALRRRIPEDADPEDVAVADEARDVLLSVMRGEVGPELAPHRLKAATYVRLEVCGPQTQKVEHSLSTLTDEQLQARLDELLKAAGGET